MRHTHADKHLGRVLSRIADEAEKRLPAESLGRRVPAPILRWGMRLCHGIDAWARRLLPPELTLRNDVMGIVRTHAIAEAARLGLADQLARGPMSSEELARVLRVDAQHLERLLGALVTWQIFERDEQGRFANNRLSRYLARAHPAALGDFATYVASASNCVAWGALDHALTHGKSAFEHALGMSVWAWFAEHPEESETFQRAMTGLSRKDAPVIARLYPWHEASVVCDVGGGMGTVLAELLREHPHLTGILCDGGHALAKARARGLGVPGARVTFVDVDFFRSLPLSADVYVLKSVLHDWDDERCLALLRVCHRSMAPGARVLVAEHFVRRGERDLPATLSDLQMMVVTDQGRERTREEVAALLKRAGFKPGRSFEHPFVDLLEGVR